MNKLSGRILRVESSGELSLVEVDADGHALSALILDTPATAPYLAAGTRVSVLFKETEVMLARPGLGLLSVRNRLACTVLGREAGSLATLFRLGCGAATLHALITTRAAEELGLKDGDAALALVKTTEVSLEAGREAGTA